MLLKTERKRRRVPFNVRIIFRFWVFYICSIVSIPYDIFRPAGLPRKNFSVINILLHMISFPGSYNFFSVVLPGISGKLLPSQDPIAQKKGKIHEIILRTSLSLTDLAKSHYGNWRTLRDSNLVHKSSLCCNLVLMPREESPHKILFSMFYLETLPRYFFPISLFSYLFQNHPT